MPGARKHNIGTSGRRRVNELRGQVIEMTSNEPGITVTEVPKSTRSANRRRRWVLLSLVCGGALVAGGRAWWADRRYQSAMEEIEAEILAHRYAIACRNLDKLLSWRADPKGGILYLLGSCELVRGRIQEAGEAWARVLPGSAFSEKAIRGRMRIFHDTGLLASAEEVINKAAADPRNDRTAVLVSLVPILSELGRVDEAEGFIENRWEHLKALGEGALDPAIKLVRQHIELTLKATPVETIRASLEQASKLAHDDDRAWLGRANLAIRTGQLAEAGRLLDACRLRRPEDIPVWQARLNWGMATHQIDVVNEALKHLSTTESNPAKVHRTTAWLAAHRGDVAAERQELELVVEADPADRTALDRLAALAQKDGQPARAAELLRQKAEVDRALARYIKLHDRKQPLRDAAELARLAKQLGRQFESRAFLVIANSDESAY
jgi:tetratricopeptide (TPR) repeat protein